MPETTAVLTVGFKDFLDVGLPPRAVDYWTRLGYLQAITPEPGSGRPRRWPEHELTVAVTMQRLRKAGLNLHVAHDVARGKTQIGQGIWVLVDHERNDRDE